MLAPTPAHGWLDSQRAEADRYSAIHGYPVVEGPSQVRPSDPEAGWRHFLDGYSKACCRPIGLRLMPQLTNPSDRALPSGGKGPLDPQKQKAVTSFCGIQLVTVWVKAP